MTTRVGTPPRIGAVPPRVRRRWRARAFPYLLTAPAVLVLAIVLGYPLVRLAVLSFQHFGLRQQFGAPPDWVGFENYRRILSDNEFWHVLWRTVAFCLVNVALTMAIAMAVAVLLTRVPRHLRLIMSIALMLAWATPPLTATVVWQWMFDSQYGLVNWFLTRLGGNFEGHSWLADPLSFYAVATIIVVWMGVPFVAFTLYAAMTQIPAEVEEAAKIDGAGPLQRFRDVTVPLLMPIIAILAALSTLWDFRVFTQIYVLQQAGGITEDTNVLGVYAYRIAIGENRFDTGAAVAIIMVLITLLLTAVYLRRMAQVEEL
jgi:N,N'-diacetylchitobiose transport system permease protein